MALSLRTRLNLLIALIFALTLLVGTSLVIHHARRAVYEESQATVNLTLQLLRLAFASEPISSQRWLLEHRTELEKTRHLHIELREGNERGRAIQESLPSLQIAAPSWFIQLVKPNSSELRRVFPIPGEVSKEIVITADPDDEITEAWEETRSLLGLLLLFFLLASGLVFVTIGRALRPIDLILKALDNIERGDYRSRLPQISLPELEAIAKKFNHMAATLEQSRKENRELLQRSLAIQEGERRFLAQELHDDMGQSLAAIKAIAVSIGQRDIDPAIKESARTLAEISGRTYEVVRGMMRRLRPVILDELGLVAALEALIDDWNAHHEEVFCRFTAQGEFGGLSDELKITLYRIVQECLTNTAKHAQATEMEVSMEYQDIDTGGFEFRIGFQGLVMLNIRDNGKGIDLNDTTPGLGLLGMRERVEALQGAFELLSCPGEGVAIRVMLPT